MFFGEFFSWFLQLVWKNVASQLSLHLSNFGANEFKCKSSNCLNCG